MVEYDPSLPVLSLLRTVENHHSKNAKKHGKFLRKLQKSWQRCSIKSQARRPLCSL